MPDSDRSTRWRVFVSHTSELREYPVEGSYVEAAERAISAAGHVIVNMADFPAADQPPEQLCIERVRSCEVYVGLLGTRYGSPVRDRPELSYTELEFATATGAGLNRLVFLLDIMAANVGIPVMALIDHEFGIRQDAFRRRVQDGGLVTPPFANPAELGRLVERSLRELADQAISAPQPEPYKDRGDALERGDRLSTGESLFSADGSVRCDMRRDGNLVACFGTRTLWDSITAQTGNANYLEFRDDGDLLLRTRDGRVLIDWRSAGMGGKCLVMQDDGNLVLYANHGRVVWATDHLKDGTRYVALRPDLRAHPKRWIPGFGGIGLGQWVDI